MRGAEKGKVRVYESLLVPTSCLPGALFGCGGVAVARDRVLGARPRISIRRAEDSCSMAAVATARLRATSGYSSGKGTKATLRTIPARAKVKRGLRVSVVGPRLQPCSESSERNYKVSQHACKWEQCSISTIPTKLIDLCKACCTFVQHARGEEPESLLLAPLPPLHSRRALYGVPRR